MSDEEPRFSPGTPVRVMDRSAAPATIPLLDYPLHDHYGEIGHVTAVEQTPRTVRYEVRFDPYGDERVYFGEDELVPALPRKT